MPHILLVDDHILLLEILRLALEGEYTISTAQSAQEALAILEKQAVDLVITDHAMPTMTGLELIRTIAKIESRKSRNEEQKQEGTPGPTIPGRHGGLPLPDEQHRGEGEGRTKIILYSACLFDDLIEEAMAAGASACMHKPFDLFELRGLIGKILICNREFHGF